MVNLNPAQYAKLQGVANAQGEYKQARATLELQLRAQLDAELAEYARRRDIAAYAAHVAGVPASQIGQLGLGVKTPTAGKEAIERGRIAYNRTFATTTPEATLAPHEQVTAPLAEPERVPYTLVSAKNDPYHDKRKYNPAPDYPERTRFDAVWTDGNGLEHNFHFYDDHPGFQGAYPAWAHFKDEDAEWEAQHAGFDLSKALTWQERVIAEHAAQ